MSGDKILCIQKAIIASLKDALQETDLKIYAFLKPLGLSDSFIHISSISKERQSMMLDKMIVEFNVFLNQQSSKPLLETLMALENALKFGIVAKKIDEFDIIGALTVESKVFVNKDGLFEGYLKHHFLMEG